MPRGNKEVTTANGITSLTICAYHLKMIPSLHQLSVGVLLKPPHESEANFNFDNMKTGFFDDDAQTKRLNEHIEAQAKRLNEHVATLVAAEVCYTEDVATALFNDIHEHYNDIQTANGGGYIPIQIVNTICSGLQSPHLGVINARYKLTLDPLFKWTVEVELRRQAPYERTSTIPFQPQHNPNPIIVDTEDGLGPRSTPAETPNKRKLAAHQEDYEDLIDATPAEAAAARVLDIWRILSWADFVTHPSPSRCFSSYHWRYRLLEAGQQIDRDTFYRASALLLNTKLPNADLLLQRASNWFGNPTDVNTVLTDLVELKKLVDQQPLAKWLEDHVYSEDPERGVCALRAWSLLKAIKEDFEAKLIADMGRPTW